MQFNVKNIVNFVFNTIHLQNKEYMLDREAALQINNSYRDCESFLLVIKRHSPGVTSLGQHTIKIVFTTSRHQPRREQGDKFR